MKHGFQYLILRTVNFRSLLNFVQMHEIMALSVLWTVDSCVFGHKNSHEESVCD